MAGAGPRLTGAAMTPYSARLAGSTVHKHHGSQAVLAVAERERSAQRLLEEGTAALLGKTYPNMDELPELEVGVVLANVAALYGKEQCVRPGQQNLSKIYTTVGPVLIAMNPFEKLPCMGHDWAEAFRQEGRACTIDTAWQRLGPHCYGTMEQVYNGLAKHPKQAVVICGESGAGKTYTNRLMIEYLLKTEDRAVGRVGSAVPELQNAAESGLVMPRRSALSRKSRVSRVSGKVKAPVVDMGMLSAGNALLEAFGNAKTGRNDNSSRFGKYCRLSMSGNPMDVKGLEVEHYLLERSRVVSVPSGERNYHVFHYLAQEEGNEEGKGPEYFKLVRSAAKEQRACGEPFDDEGDFEELSANISQAGFSMDEEDHIFQYIRACMYLGNVEFEEGKVAGSSVVSGATMADLRKCCSLLGIDADKFSSALTSMYVKTPTEGTIRMDLEVPRADGQRDSVTKMLYSRIFDWIVRILNSRLAGRRDEIRRNSATPSSVGLLDIFGFEDMPINEFVQLFINLTNENIQYLFNEIMIERELQVYRDEGISSFYVAPPSNKPCLDLFLAPPPNMGIVGWIAERLKEAGNQLEKSDGETFVQQRLNPKFKSHPNYIECNPQMIRAVQLEKQRRWGTKPDIFYKECFQVKHYAGVVTYTVRGFLEKSRDNLEEHIFEVFKQSTEKDLQDLFAQETEAASSKRLTVGEKFVIQMQQLTRELDSSNTVFVRCIKPTPHQKPKLLDASMVLEQLTMGGVVSALEMRRVGLPDRMGYHDFLQEFWQLESGDYREKKTKVSDQARCEKMLQDLVAEERDGGGAVVQQWALGGTKLFMRSGVMKLLRNCCAWKTKMGAVRLQRAYKAHRGRKLQDTLNKQHLAIQEMKARAEEVGCLENAELQSALAQADGELKDTHGRVQALVEQAQEEMKRDPRYHDQQWANFYVMREVSSRGSVSLARLGRSVADARAAFQEAMKAREKVLERVDAHCSERAKDVSEWLEKLEVCKELCTDQDTEQAQACLDQVEETKTFLQNILVEDVPMLRKKLLAGLSKETDAKDVQIPPDIDNLFKEAQDRYGRIAKKVDELVEERKRYERELLEADPAFQQKMASRREQVAKLQELSEQAEEFEEVMDLINAAMEKDVEIDDLKRKVAPVEQLKAAADGFLAAAERAAAALEEAQLAKAMASEQARKMYTEAFDAFENASELKKAALHLERLVRKLRAELRSDSGLSDASQHSGGRAAQEMLRRPSMRPVRERILRNLTSVEHAMEGLDLQVGPEDEEQEFSIVPLGALAIMEGDWSVEYSDRLGPEIPERCRQGGIAILDREKYTSVVGAVQALNKGEVVVQEGFCIGWSEAQQGYFLLCQPRRQAEAYNAIGGAPSSFFKGRRMHEAVRKVCDTNKLKELAAMARKLDEDRTRELRDELQGEIERLERLVQEAQDDAIAAKQGELAQVEATAVAQRDLADARAELKSMRGELKKTTKVADALRTTMIEAEGRREKHETNLRVALEDANSVMESQRLQIRQIQVMSNHKDVRRTMHDAVHDSSHRMIGARKTQHMTMMGMRSTEEQARAMVHAASAVAAASSSTPGQCHGDCEEALAAQAELKDMRSINDALEEAVLRLRQELMLAKAEHFEEVSSFDEGDSRKEIARLRGQLQDEKAQVSDLSTLLLKARKELVASQAHIHQRELAGAEEEADDGDGEVWVDGMVSNSDPWCGSSPPSPRQKAKSNLLTPGTGGAIGREVWNADGPLGKRFTMNPGVRFDGTMLQPGLGGSATSSASGPGATARDRGAAAAPDARYMSMRVTARASAYLEPEESFCSLEGVVDAVRDQVALWCGKRWEASYHRHRRGGGGVMPYGPHLGADPWAAPAAEFGKLNTPAAGVFSGRFYDTGFGDARPSEPHGTYIGQGPPH